MYIVYFVFLFQRKYLYWGFDKKNWIGLNSCILCKLINFQNMRQGGMQSPDNFYKYNITLCEKILKKSIKGIPLGTDSLLI